MYCHKNHFRGFLFNYQPLLCKTLLCNNVTALYYLVLYYLCHEDMTPPCLQAHSIQAGSYAGTVGDNLQHSRIPTQVLSLWWLVWISELSALSGRDRGKALLVSAARQCKCRCQIDTVFLDRCPVACPVLDHGSPRTVPAGWHRRPAMDRTPHGLLLHDQSLHCRPDGMLGSLCNQLSSRPVHTTVMTVSEMPKQHP